MNDFSIVRQLWIDPSIRVDNLSFKGTNKNLSTVFKLANRLFTTKRVL